ncbi:MAG: hypothetical protein D6782_03875 [Alphaproteobacteria bacterium]|nr:MAG: hypothetical protein D6782_03875 [Alphaproteobacteria bacterium]
MPYARPRKIKALAFAGRRRGGALSRIGTFGPSPIGNLSAWMTAGFAGPPLQPIAKMSCNRL